MSRRATRAEVVAAVLTLIADRAGGGTMWIGIDGCGASGKSTLAAMIAAASDVVDVVHIDDFSAPTIKTYDQQRFLDQVVTPLLAGLQTEYQIWDWTQDVGGPWVSLAAGRVVVVEGVSAISRELPIPYVLQVWVEAPRQVRLDRALERDGASMLHRWTDDWMPSEDSYVAREHPERTADLIVDGTDPA